MTTTELDPPAPEAVSRSFEAGSVVMSATGAIIDITQALARISLDGKPGFTTMTAEDLARFKPANDAQLPIGPYRLLDIDTGAETRGIPPSEGLAKILEQSRSPLTIEEGIALVATHPGVLRKNHCFYLAGSSCGDRRVPALWLSGGRPRLGWCWAGSPHSWLGMASCAVREALGR